MGVRLLNFDSRVFPSFILSARRSNSRDWADAKLPDRQKRLNRPRKTFLRHVASGPPCTHFLQPELLVPVISRNLSRAIIVTAILLRGVRS
jgi:hypothetical protein